jgi:chorismate-pyruvate lyase
MQRLFALAEPKTMMHLTRWTTALLLAASSAAALAETPAWPDSYIGRLQAQALLQTLNAQILASTSATLSLEKWCADHGMAREPKVVARLLRGADQPAAPEVRARLAVAPDTPLTYRRVQLYCGEHLLSEADNWYVPGRLTAAMNQLLEQTDTPFGKVVLPLAPYRRTVAATTLWSPLPERWESQTTPAAASAAPGAMAIPAALFEHRAVLYTREHEPIAEVRETYQRGLLAFPPPAAR